MATKLNILDLPNDCLIHTYNNLSFTDLLSIKESCKRFYPAVEATFIANHKALEITCWTYSDTYSIRTGYDCSCAVVDFIEIVNILRNFGEWITSLTISGGSAEPAVDITRLLHLVNECCNENLKFLSLQNVIFNSDSADDLAGLFCHLEELRLLNVLNGIGVAKCLNNCVNLRKLLMIAEKCIEGSFELNFNVNLERIRYRCVENIMSADDTRRLLRSCPKLTSMHVSGHFVPCGNSLSYLTKIQTVAIDLLHLDPPDLGQCDWKGLFQLENLQRFELNLCENLGDLLSTVSSSPPTNVEVLVLNIRRLNDITNLLKTFTFTKLTTLIINCDRIVGTPGFESNAVKTAVRNLHRLNEVHFIRFPMDSFDYILQIVENVPRLDALLLSTKPYDKLSYVDIMRLIDVQKSKVNQLTVFFDYKTFVEFKAIVQCHVTDNYNFMRQQSNVVKFAGYREAGDEFANEF